MGKKIIKTILFCFCLSTQAFSQGTNSLTIDAAFAMAQHNYHLVKQMALIEKTKQYSIENAARGYLPQLSINGQGTYRLQ